MFYNLTNEQKEIIDNIIGKLIPLDGNNLLRLKSMKELASKYNDTHADNLLTVHKIITSKQKLLEKNLINVYLVIYERCPDMAKQYAKKLMTDVNKLNTMVAKLKSALEVKDANNGLLNYQLSKQMPAIQESKLPHKLSDTFAHPCNHLMVPGGYHNTFLGTATH